MGLADIPAVSFEDDLTGLYNRRFLQRFLTTQIDWKAEGSQAYSFVLLDLDEFHKVNDLYGHAEGDYVLQSFAERLRKAFRADDVVARDSGDSFFIVLPGLAKAEAATLARQVVTELVQTPLRTRRDRFPVDLTASAGVVTFPDDARDADAVREAADKVLFHAKRSGRNRVSVGGEIDEHLAAERDIFAGLPCKLFCGRASEFQAAIGVLDDLRQGRPTVLFVQGPAGIGKSRFLREVAEVATARDVLYLYAICNESQRQSVGYSLIYLVDQYYRLNPESQQDLHDCLFPAQRRIARELIASLSGWRAEDVEVSPRDRKPLLLGMLETAVLSMARRSPLLILLDNARHCDRGTLEVLQRILRDRRAPVAVFFSLKGDVRKIDAKADPGLMAFVDDLQRAGSMQALTLVPLGREDVTGMVNAILPGANPSREFLELLLTRSAGNPLYVEEAIRSLILRDRIRREGDRCTILGIEPDELPASLDAVIEQVLSTLSPEAGELVTNASIIGSRFDIQVLQEVMGKREAETLDAVDEVQQTKLIEHLERGTPDDYAFRSSTARDVRYVTTADEAKKLMHRRLATIAKAQAIRMPERMRAEHTYHAAASGAAPAPSEAEDEEVAARPAVVTAAPAVIGRVPRIPEAKVALAPEGVRHATDFMRAVAALLRIGRLYPQWSQAGAQFTKQLRDSLALLLELAPAVTFGTDARGLTINGSPADTSRAADVLHDFASLLGDRLVAALTIGRGFDTREVDALMTTLAAPMNRARTPADFWDQFLDREEIRHVDVLQRRYVAQEGQTRIMRREQMVQRPLTAEEFEALRDALRHFKTAADNLRLYPPGHAMVEESMRDAVASLTALLPRLKLLALAASDAGLLVNGAPTDARTVGDAGGYLAAQLGKRELKSLSLLEGLRPEEVHALVSIFAVPAEDPSWKTVFQTVFAGNDMKHVEFGGLLYTQLASVAGGTVPTGPVAHGPAPAHAAGAEFRAAHAAPPARTRATPRPDPSPVVPYVPGTADATPRRGTPAYAPGGGAGATAGDEAEGFTGATVRADVRARAYLKAGPEKFLSEDFEREFGPLMEVLNYGWTAQLGAQLVGRLVELAQDPNPPFRTRALQILARGLNETASPDARGPIVSQATDVLGALVTAETDADVLRQAAETCSSCITSAFALGRIEAATTLLSNVRKRIEARGAPPEFKSKIAARLQDLAGPKGPLVEAIKNVSPTMREAALKLSGMFGAAIVPVLVDFVADSDDQAHRRLAALALKECGGGADLARLVAPDGPADKIVRVLSVLELSGVPLAAPLLAAVEHAEPNVRAAAFAMIKRGDRSGAAAALRKLVGAEKPELAIAAIALAAECGLSDLAYDVTRIAQHSTDDAVVRACCDYFVRVKTPSAVPALRRIYDTRAKMFGLVKGFSDETRAMAVKAASGIMHPEAAGLVELAKKDRSLEVRRAAGAP